MNDEIETTEDELIEDEDFVVYDIATYPSDFTLSGIFDMWKNQDLEIPDFQREFVWSINQSSLLVESFMLGLPVPPVFLYIDKTNKNLVIDGQQRILSFCYFISGYWGDENLHGKRQVFRLKGLAERSPYAGKTFEEFNESEKRQLRNCVLRAINVRQLGPDDEGSSVFHIFERLNTGGTALKPQEIRNCVYRGGFSETLRELNKNPDWRRILGKKNLDKHQRDVELLLRVFALRYYWREYEKPMKGFLNEKMKANQSGETSKVKEFKEKFPVACKELVEALGDRPFHARGPLNSSILDVMLVSLLSGEVGIDELSKRYASIISEKTFSDYTSLATTDTATVGNKFKYVLNSFKS